jgi:hypothetical protein
MNFDMEHLFWKISTKRETCPQISERVAYRRFLITLHSIFESLPHFFRYRSFMTRSIHGRLEDDQKMAVVVKDQDSKMVIGESRWNVKHEYKANHDKET